ncbi:transposase [Pseudofrankia sp. BMG5.37]|nr:transposase [Pseudofrankia sp. BMG5.37]MDT3440361.1 transposase [Pseudofrankia sp. BMG5.37]
MTTKLHLACENGQKPLALLVTAGQRGDSPQFTAVLERIRVPRSGRGRPRTCPDRVLADKAYSSKKNRTYLRRRGIRATIPEKKDQAANRKKLGSRGAATVVQQGRLQAAPPRGVRHQPVETPPGRRDPV